MRKTFCSLLPFFLALFIAGCSDRGGVPTGSGHTSPKDESDLSSGWTGVWKGTADYLKVDYQNYINNRFMDWRKDETCVIMITSYEPNYIYFNIQEPSPIQIFTSVQSDTSLFVFQKDKRFKYEIYAVKSNDEMTGIAVEYKYEPEYERGFFRQLEIRFSCDLYHK